MFFYLLTLLGIGMLIFLRIRGDADLEPDRSSGVCDGPATRRHHRLATRTAQ